MKICILLLLTICACFGNTLDLVGEPTHNKGNLHNQNPGDAMYRTGAAGYSHVGLFFHANSGGRVIEIEPEIDLSLTSVRLDVVRELPIAEFAENGEVYLGAYANNELMKGNAELRQQIIGKVLEVYARTDLYYTIWGQIDWYGDSWDGTVADLENIRCDGLVELAYEHNHVPVWGQNADPSRYLIQDYPEDHNSEPDYWIAADPNPATELVPSVQRGGYGQQYTRLRPSIAATSLEIVGPERVVEGESVEYRCVVSYSDGTVEDFTERALWQIDVGNILGLEHIDLQAGRLDLAHVDADVSFEITASVTGLDLSERKRLTAENGVLSIPYHTQNVGASYYDGSFPIETNLPWIAESAAAWVSWSRNGPVLAYSVAQNLDLEPRHATLLIRAGELTRTLTISQAGADPWLALSATSESFTASGGSGRFEVSGTTSWTASDSADWLQVVAGYGQVEFSLQENLGTSGRSASIRITDGVVSESFFVSQRGAGQFLALGADSAFFSAVSGATRVDVESNSSWAATSSVPWLTVTFGSAGSGKGYFTYSVLANPAGSVRTGSVMVNANGFAQIHRVAQSGGVHDSDIHRIAQWFGSRDSLADLNGDGVVNIFDLVILQQSR